jgi:sugar phosphate isomerase/epimerase
VYAIALNQATLYRCTTEQFVRAAAKSGFSAIELREDKLRGYLRVRPLTQLEDLIGELDLRVIALNGLEFFGLCPKQNHWVLESDAEIVANLCAVLDIPTVISPLANTTELGNGTDDYKSGDFARTVRANIGVVLDVFSSYDIKLALEPVGFDHFPYKTIGDIEDLLAGTEWGAKLELAPDIHNISNAGDSVDDLIGTSLDFSIVHLNDTKAEEAPNEIHVLSSRTMPGEGKLKVADWVRKLTEHSFEGYFSLELFDEIIWSMDPDAAAALCWNNLQSFFMSADNDHHDHDADTSSRA